ncbi:MAG: hypothetical protein Q8J88_11355 [Bacteroidales bacterium]|nr:hypothetical protein [Bacteroidales bacterium]
MQDVLLSAKLRALASPAFLVPRQTGMLRSTRLLPSSQLASRLSKNWSSTAWAFHIFNLYSINFAQAVLHLYFIFFPTLVNLFMISLYWVSIAFQMYLFPLLSRFLWHVNAKATKWCQTKRRAKSSFDAWIDRITLILNPPKTTFLLDC